MARQAAVRKLTPKQRGWNGRLSRGPRAVARQRSNIAVIREITADLLKRQKTRQMRFSRLLAEVRKVYGGRIRVLFFISGLVFDPEEQFDLHLDGTRRNVRLR